MTRNPQLMLTEIVVFPVTYQSGLFALGKKRNTQGECVSEFKLNININLTIKIECIVSRK